MAEKYDLMSLRTIIAIITPGDQSKDRRREVSGQGGEAVRPKDGRAMVRDRW